MACATISTVSPDSARAGILPGTLIYTAFGAGLGEMFAAGGTIRLSDALSPTLLTGLAGLGLLALLPVAWHWVRGRWAGRGSAQLETPSRG